MCMRVPVFVCVSAGRAKPKPAVPWHVQERKRWRRLLFHGWWRGSTRMITAFCPRMSWTASNWTAVRLLKISCVFHFKFCMVFAKVTLVEYNTNKKRMLLRSDYHDPARGAVFRQEHYLTSFLLTVRVIVISSGSTVFFFWIGTF